MFKYETLGKISREHTVMVLTDAAHLAMAAGTKYWPIVFQGGTGFIAEDNISEDDLAALQKVSASLKVDINALLEAKKDSMTAAYEAERATKLEEWKKKLAADEERRTKEREAREKEAQVRKAAADATRAAAEAKRRADIRRKFAGSPFLQTILDRKISLGMTSQMVTASWGRPDDTNRSVGSWGVHEQWVYGDTYVYIENGVLTSWQD